MLLRHIVIAQHMRGLAWKDGFFMSFLEPGRRRIFDPLNRWQVEQFDLRDVEFKHTRVEFIMQSDAEGFNRHLQKVELNEHEVGLLYLDGHLTDVLAPAQRRMYWRGPVDVRVDRIDIAADFRVPRAIAAQLARTLAAQRSSVKSSIVAAEVPENHAGLLSVDGELTQRLAAGLHVFWKFNRAIRVELEDLRQRVMEVSGQEILTKDKVSLRVNLSASWQMPDPVKARAELADPQAFLYRELQFALRQIIGTRSLDELLADKDALNGHVFHAVRERVTAHGMVLDSVGVKDIILPGEMKDILNQVVATEKAAQANVIKRREETAATRSLLNTARLMEENPILLRLKELEVLEKISEKVERLTVFGGLDAVLQDTVKINVKAD